MAKIRLSQIESSAFKNSSYVGRSVHFLPEYLIYCWVNELQATQQ